MTFVLSIGQLNELVVAVAQVLDCPDRRNEPLTQAHRRHAPTVLDKLRRNQDRRTSWN